ncbi:MAG: hypothetical protein AB4058_13770 [Microcystaceae cyanobacterium]
MRSPLLFSSLQTFLRQEDIETSPAWEFINGQALQKTMPTLFHSRLNLHRGR